MAGDVFNINGGAAMKVEEKETRHVRGSHYAEDRTAQYLLVGKDEHGKAVYFIRMNVIGLRRRVFGPFRRKAHAITAFDGFLGHVLEGFTDLMNETPDDGRSNFGRMMIEPPANVSTVR